MEFIKKNWTKLLLALALTVAVVFAVLLVFNSLSVLGVEGLGDVEKSQYNSSLFTYLGMCVALLGIVVALMLNVLDKGEKILPIIIIAVGAIALILLIVAMIMGTDALNAAKDGLKMLEESATAMGKTPQELATIMGESAGYYEGIIAQINAGTYGSVFNLIVFAIAPVCYGLNKLFKK